MRLENDTIIIVLLAAIIACVSIVIIGLFIGIAIERAPNVTQPACPPVQLVTPSAPTEPDDDDEYGLDNGPISIDI